MSASTASSKSSNHRGLSLLERLRRMKAEKEKMAENNNATGLNNKGVKIQPTNLILESTPKAENSKADSAVTSKVEASPIFVTSRRKTVASTLRERLLKSQADAKAARDRKRKEQEALMANLTFEKPAAAKVEDETENSLYVTANSRLEDTDSIFEDADEDVPSEAGKRTSSLKPEVLMSPADFMVPPPPPTRNTSGNDVEQDKKQEGDVSKQLWEFLHPDEIKAKIVRQVEHYFGDYNLPKDKFMAEVMDENGGWIPLEVLMTFKRLRKLSEDSQFVLAILADNYSDIIEVDLRGRRICRNPAKPAPNLNRERMDDLEKRTLFITGFDADTTDLDRLLEFFEEKMSEFKVGNIRMRRAKNEEKANGGKDDKKTLKALLEEGDDEDPGKTEGRFLGSIFATFANKESAKEFLGLLRRGQVKFTDGKLLKGKWQADFFSQRRGKTEYNDVFDPVTLPKTAFVSSFDRKDITDVELAAFFRTFAGFESVTRRCSRCVFQSNNGLASNSNNEVEREEGEWTFLGSVFVVFDSPERLEEFILDSHHGKVRYNGDKVLARTQKSFFVTKGLFRKELMEL